LNFNQKCYSEDEEAARKQAQAFAPDDDALHQSLQAVAR
jgi:hypothetical protein